MAAVLLAAVAVVAAWATAGTGHATSWRRLPAAGAAVAAANTMAEA